MDACILVCLLRQIKRRTKIHKVPHRVLSDISCVKIMRRTKIRQIKRHTKIHKAPQEVISRRYTSFPTYGVIERLLVVLWYTDQRAHARNQKYFWLMRDIAKCIYETVYVSHAMMGSLPLVGSLKSWVSFAEYRLFYRSLLQKRR